VPTPYAGEFRRDVVAVARQGDQSRAQVAHSFGISESCLARWLRIAEREDGGEPVPTGRLDEVEVRELRRRNKQLEQENEILRRASALGQGSQFRSHAFVRVLHDHGLVGSMGRVGACADNAAMESFSCCRRTF